MLRLPSFLKAWIAALSPRLRVVPSLAVAVLIAVSVSAVAQQLPDGTSSGLQQILQGITGQSGNGSAMSPPASAPMILYQAAPQIGPLPRSRLEQIMSSRAGVNLTQFGYDQLGVGRDVTVPQSGAIQDSYILGPGDQINVSLRGQENNEYQAFVNRNGQVVLPRISPILAAGRTLGAFRADLIRAAQRAYISTQIFVSIGQVRQINVLVAGQVNNPGTRQVTALSSVVDALLLSGGVAKTGSLRNVKLVRNGNTTTIDLYSVLTQRGNQNSVLLTDGDRIVVPPLGPTVTVTGWVRRPGIYELAPGTKSLTARGLMSLAGGTETRGRYRLSILRIEPNGALSQTAATSEGAMVRDSEILFVQPGASETVQQATLSGGNPLAGTYSIGKATKLSDVLSAPGALGTDPYTLLGVVVRRDPATGMRVLIPFTPVAVVHNRENMDLLSGDVVRILSANEARLVSAVVKTFKQQRADAASQLINPTDPALNPFAGGLPASTSSAQNQQNLQGYQSNAISSPPDEREDIAALSNEVLTDGGILTDPQNVLGNQFNLPTTGTGGSSNHSGTQTMMGKDAPVVGLQSPMLASAQGRSIVNDNQANGGAQTSAAQSSIASSPNGFAANAGSGSPGLSGGIAMSNVQSPYNVQPLPGGPTPPLAPNFQDQALANADVPENLEVATFGQLSRQMNVDALVLVHFFSDNMASVGGSVHGAGDYLVGPDVTLQDAIAAAGGIDSWTDGSHVELLSTVVDPATGSAHTERKLVSLDPMTLSTAMLHPHDEVRFSQVYAAVGNGSVTLQGQVRFPGVYKIEHGERLSDVLLRAGGVTDVAYPYGAIFLRKSAAVAERIGYDHAATEVNDAIVTGMTRQSNGRISSDSLGAMQGFVAQLRTTRALGRITVSADPAVLASNPQRDLLLEPGDVIFIPQRPSSVMVMGQVSQPGSIPFDSRMDAYDYIDRAGGLNASADDTMIYIVYPDGTARRLEKSWLSLNSPNIPPGSTIVVPRDFDQVDLRQVILDLSQIFSQIAVAAASLAVVSRYSN
jgi:polysaccharide biosynthesis/export protein